MNALASRAKPWTDADRQFVRDHYRKRPAAEIASELGRTVLAVQMMAKTIGAVAKRDKEKAKRNREEIKRLHAQGLTDSEIGNLIGWSRRHVGKIRAQLGMPDNRGSERYRKRVAEKTKEQCEKAGLQTLADVRRAAYCELIRRMGWPDHLSLRAAQLAEFLWIHGPLTRKQLANLAGVRWLGSNGTFKTNKPGGSYLAELQRAGLVVQLRKAVPNGYGFAESIYMLALGVAPCRENPSHPIQPVLSTLKRR